MVNSQLVLFSKPLVAERECRRKLPELAAEDSMPYAVALAQSPTDPIRQIGATVTPSTIWERIQREMPQVQLCERTVRGYVQERKLALGLTVQETFVPQSYDWGVEAVPTG